MLRIQTTEAIATATTTPTARRKAISSTNDSNANDNSPILNDEYNHDHHNQRHCPPSSPVSGSAYPTSLATPPTSTSSTCVVRRQKRISTTFGGPGSVSGSGSGSSNSTLTPTSVPSPLSPLFESLTLTHSPATLSSNPPLSPQYQTHAQQRLHPFDLHPEQPHPSPHPHDDIDHQLHQQKQEVSLQHPLTLSSTSPRSATSPLESGTFGLPQPILPTLLEDFPKQQQQTLQNRRRQTSATGTPLISDDIAIVSSSLTINNDSDSDYVTEGEEEEESTQDQKGWSPTATGRRARFTFGFDDKMLHDILEILPSSSPTSMVDSNSKGHAHTNHINVNNINHSNHKDVQQNNINNNNNMSNMKKNDIPLPPLPLSSSVHSPRIQSTSTKPNPNTTPPATAFISTTATSFFFPKRASWAKRHSFIFNMGASSGSGTENTAQATNATTPSNAGVDAVANEFTTSTGPSRRMPVRSSSRCGSLRNHDSNPVNSQGRYNSSNCTRTSTDQGSIPEEPSLTAHSSSSTIPQKPRSSRRQRFSLLMASILTSSVSSPSSSSPTPSTSAAPTATTSSVSTDSSTVVDYNNTSSFEEKALPPVPEHSIFPLTEMNKDKSNNYGFLASAPSLSRSRSKSWTRSSKPYRWGGGSSGNGGGTEVTITTIHLPTTGLPRPLHSLQQQPSQQSPPPAYIHSDHSHHQQQQPPQPQPQMHQMSAYSGPASAAPSGTSTASGGRYLGAYNYPSQESLVIGAQASESQSTPESQDSPHGYEYGLSSVPVEGAGTAPKVGDGNVSRLSSRTPSMASSCSSTDPRETKGKNRNKKQSKSKRTKQEGKDGKETTKNKCASLTIFRFLFKK